MSAKSLLHLEASLILRDISIPSCKKSHLATSGLSSLGCLVADALPSQAPASGYSPSHLSVEVLHGSVDGPSRKDSAFVSKLAAPDLWVPTKIALRPPNPLFPAARLASDAASPSIWLNLLKTPRIP